MSKGHDAAFSFEVVLPLVLVPVAAAGPQDALAEGLVSHDLVGLVGCEWLNGPQALPALGLLDR